MAGIDGLVLLTTQQTVEAERRAMAAGHTGYDLMLRAGKAAAEACEALGTSARTASVLCGPGNNGGDGFVVAQRLREAGWDVVACSLDPGTAPSGDAGRAKADWQGETRASAAFDPTAAALIVDALFGSGLSRPLANSAAALVEAVNASDRTVLAVDMPSGVDGSTGAIHGTAVMAHTTVTFGTAKPGHYLYPGRGRRGRLVVADIGLGPGVPEYATFLNAPGLWLPDYPWPDPDGHKYRRGHAVVVSGGLSHTGAARMAARAALRIGAGLVTLASPGDALAVNAAALTAVMVRAAEGPAGLAAILADARKNAVILGPGLGVGEATRALVGVALAPQRDRPDAASPRACLLDADALTSFADDAAGLAHLISSSPRPVVITPHDGEFARLFSADPGILEGDKLTRTRAAAHRLGCVVLLKGADTVVAAPDGRAAISDGGAPWLATAGSGDVLAGMIGGLLAQGMPAFEAANAGNHLHTAAGRIFGPGLIAEDLPETLPRALRELRTVAGLSPA